MAQFLSFNNTQHHVLQILALLGTIAGALFVEWSLLWITVGVVCYYLYAVIGVSMVLHRYYAHRSFEFRNKYLKWMFTVIAILAARGTPTAWVKVHRKHHRHADTIDDPHCPENLTFFSFRSAFTAELNIFSIRDMLTSDQKFLNNYYILIIAFWIVLLAIISPTLLYFAWVLPVCLTQIFQDIWNYYGHVHVGSRNFSTKDNSKNNVWLWPIILGEAWHNNHHHSPRNYTTQVKNHELDPAAVLINLVRLRV
jgi:stearoyl-CoA desaturase (delta-9 desaturase)